jgi:murein DD-endopeptidase MepM/ murein hydrolase activator NlpD
MLIAGNYVIVDHGHGEHSAFFHLQQGSVSVKPGDAVREGQVIGRMGFSGDAFTVHLHYQLQAGPEFDVEGLPSVLHDYGRVLGSRRLRVERAPSTAATSWSGRTNQFGGPQGCSQRRGTRAGFLP